MFQEPRAKRTAPTKRSPLRLVGEAVSLVLLSAMVLAAIVLIIVPFVTGSQTYTVLTSSMAPKYAPGTLIVVKPAPYAELQAGDIVTYQIESGRPEVITHRITAFTTDQDGNKLLVTKGDNNDVADEEPVREIQVRGKLFYAVPYAGFLANALAVSGRGIFVTLLAVALITTGIFMMIRDLVLKKRDGAGRSEETDDATIEDEEAPTDVLPDVVTAEDAAPVDETTEDHAVAETSVIGGMRAA